LAFIATKELDQSTSASKVGGGLVELRSMSLKFAKQTVLSDINIVVPRGQTVAIIGESGCGKTMLLKTIAGLIRPTAGEIFYDGVDINSLSDIELTQLRCKFGFVFQNAALFDSMTIGQNVAFPLVQHSLAQGREIDRLVIERLAEVGLPESVINKRPSQLSGGMRKRVGLARALVLQPELLLYDEPTTGLDPIMSDVINELMLSTRLKEGVTSIIVTHDMKSAKKVADRVIMLYPFMRLRNGEPQVIFDGTPDELQRTKDKRVRQFVEGEAGERLMEMRRESNDDAPSTAIFEGNYPHQLPKNETSKPIK
jgi:phospholipid/cholesterol/gamma-HCH transport system ATP-binding protein